MRNTYKIFVVKFAGKRFFSMHCHDKEGNVKAVKVILDSGEMRHILMIFISISA